MKRIRRIILSSILIALLIIAGVTTYLFYLKKNVPNQDKIERGEIQKVSSKSCLEENEFIDYTIDERYAKEIQIPTVPVTISIRDKSTLESKKSFIIDNITPLIRIHKCGIYVLRDFDRESSNYREELWKYDYSGKGTKLFLLFAFLDNQPKGILYNGFVIDPNERYLVLEKSYLSQDDYALVIKDLNTKEDLLVLNLKDVLVKYPDVIPGSFGLGSWTKDGKYLRGDIFDGALDTAYYQIEAGTWKTEIYPSPSDLLAGVERAINYEKWYLAYVDIPTFTGVQDVYEQIIEKAKKEGKQKNFYLYNLITKEKTKIVSAEPEWRFNIKWLSDAELQYELPSGEKRFTW